MPCKYCHKSHPKVRRMRTASCKAKGRRLQQRVRDDLRILAPQLDPTDIESTPMGCNGVDVKLSKAARDFFGELAIECKNCERLDVVGIFQKHAAKYPGKVPLLVHARNHTEPMVTLPWQWFLLLLPPRRVGSVDLPPDPYVPQIEIHSDNGPFKRTVRPI